MQVCGDVRPAFNYHGVYVYDKMYVSDMADQSLQSLFRAHTAAVTSFEHAKTTKATISPSRVPV